MHLLSGLPYPLIHTGIPFTYPKLEKNAEADVLIIGGGISGALIAHYLQRSGKDCIIADARSIGLGSTCASTSLLQYELDTPLSELIPMVGKEKAIRAYKLCEQAIDTLQKIHVRTHCDAFEVKKSLYCAARKKQMTILREEFQARKENGFEVAFLDAADLKKVYGIRAPGAILSEKAAQTNAYCFTHSIHQYNISHGSRVFDRTEIVHINRHKKIWKAKTAEGYFIQAVSLVFANGYEAATHLPDKLVDMYSTYAFVTEQFSSQDMPKVPDVVFWNNDDPYLYMRGTADGRIMAGGGDDVFHGDLPKEQRIRRKCERLGKRVALLLPQITIQPEFMWAGVFAGTTDGLPFIGCLKKDPGKYFALGYGGNGITFSVVAAEILCEMICSGKSANASLFSFNR